MYYILFIILLIQYNITSIIVHNCKQKEHFLMFTDVKISLFTFVTYYKLC